MYEVITKARFKGKIYGPGLPLPEEFIAPDSWIEQGIVKKIEHSKSRISKKGDLENGR